MRHNLFQTTVRHAGYFVAGLSLLASFPPALEAQQNAGIPAGCTLKATLVVRNCSVHQIMECEKNPPGMKFTDIYINGQFAGREFHAGGLVMLEWRRGTFLQRLKPDDAGKFHGNIANFGNAAPGSKISYGFTLERSKLRSKQKQSVKGKATTTHEGEVTLTIDGTPVKVRKIATEVTWENNAASSIKQYFDPELGIVVRHDQTHQSPDGKKSPAMSTGVVKVFVKGDANFGLVSPAIDPGSCRRPRR